VSGDPGNSTPVRWAAWAVFAFLAVVSLGWTGDWLATLVPSIFATGSPARLLVAGEDAYHYKWLPGAPETWCDVYANRALPITKTTVTPAMLLVAAPSPPLPIPSPRRFGFSSSGPCSGNLVALARTACEPALADRLDGLGRGLYLDSGLAAPYRSRASLCPSRFLFSLWLTLSIKQKAGASKWAGAVAGLLIAVRPPFLLILLPSFFFGAGISGREPQPDWWPGSFCRF